MGTRRRIHKGPGRGESEQNRASTDIHTRVTSEDGDTNLFNTSDDMAGVYWSVYAMELWMNQLCAKRPTEEWLIDNYDGRPIYEELGLSLTKRHWLEPQFGSNVVPLNEGKHDVNRRRDGRIVE